ncbi:MAG: lysozyme [Elainellaceae cyanobacterium]
MYAIQFNIDTWLKASTAQGSELPDSEREFVAAGTVFPVSSYESVGNNHTRLILGRDAEGNQVQPKGRIEWYVYAPAANVYRVPVVDAYRVEFNVGTWLKQSKAQASSLSADQKYQISPMSLPISGFLIEGEHLKVTFGKDSNGQQVQFLGRNTWYVYKPHADILLNGTPIYGYTLKVNTDTWLKQNEEQAIDLPDEAKHFVPQGTVLPISGFQTIRFHLRFTLGKDELGNQIQFRELNTWYVYGSHVVVLHNGQPYSLKQVTNEKGLRLIKSFEGLRLAAYQDSVGVWTIGYGTTSGVYPGMVITTAQAEQFLQQDLERFEAAVRQFVKVPVNSDQFSALVVFAYNVGEGALSSSTLLRQLNSGAYAAAADEFLNWVYAGGRFLAGLLRRRQAERALFLGENFTVFL